MSDAMRNRGPDGSGLWTGESAQVVFGHRRLAILDLSEAGAQPMVEESSGCAITFNGEIYNFQEIKLELQTLGEQFRSTSDTEVVLKAYRHWGLSLIPRLRGIFAMAIWDPRSRSVHLVRDQMGIKPLYWTKLKGSSLGREVILFASELRGLLASEVVPRRLDPAGVATYLSQGFVVGPGTILDGVQLLPAGSVLTFSLGEGTGSLGPGTFQAYWAPPSSNVRRTTVDEVRAELASAVRMQLVSDAPLGVFLSGGIDSSAVAALASKSQSDALHTFTIGFEESGLDESEFAARVAAEIGSRHTNVTLREQDFLSHLPDALNAIDQPTFDGLNTYFVSRAARQAGMTVALAGTGGDELFGGYPSFAELPKLRRVGAWVPGPVKSLFGAAGRQIARAYWGPLKRSPPQTRWGKLADAICAGNDLLDLYQVSYALFTRETQERMASDRIRSAQSAQEFGLPLAVAGHWRERIKGSEARHAVSLLELASFVGERLLRDTDAASMAVSLEVRVPLLDHALIEAVAGLEPDRRFLPLGKKKLLRELALSDLDPAIFDRPKSGFVLPIGKWAGRSLRPEMARVLSDASLVSRAGLDPESVNLLWNSYVAGRPGLYWSRVWSLYVLVSWCEKHDVGISA